MRHTRWIHILLAVCILAGVGVLVYAERYQYVGHDPDLYRVDRLTGTIDKWSPQGWSANLIDSVPDPFANLAPPRRDNPFDKYGPHPIAQPVGAKQP